MKNERLRDTLYYVLLISGFTAIMYWIVGMGGDLETGKEINVPENDGSHWYIFSKSFLNNLGHPMAVLLMQIVTIILVARILSWICQKIGQPTVIGEIVAGILLGPSLVGMYFPEFFSVMFPEHSLENLHFLSQIGLILFMFVIGMEIDLNVLKKQAYKAIVMSHTSIIIPFTLGLGLAYFLFHTFAPSGVNFLSFGLFLGISMSLTAFPVLARIIQERGIHKTPLGTLVITCAAIDDITAWSLLAIVIAIVKAGSFMSALPTIFMALGYIFLMLKVVSPFLKRIGELHSSRENLSKPIVAIFFLILIFSSYLTEIIGIHALFGAFVAGTIMPEQQQFKRIFIEKVEDVALILLLPLFFVYTGLRTQIGLLNDPYLWKICGLVILVAIVGKFSGYMMSAKIVGQNWRNSITIGVMMNTRGLVELVALNIGFDLGVLTPEIFAMLVIMALVTTFMTGPILDLIEWIYKRKPALFIQEMEQLSRFKIMISFGRPEMGATLLRLANGLIKKNKENSYITAMHLTPGNLFNNYKMDDYEKESFAPIMAESKKLSNEIIPVFKASDDIAGDIVTEANNGNYDLLLIGIGHSIYEGSMLGKVLKYTRNIINIDTVVDILKTKGKKIDYSTLDERTRQIFINTKISVGVLINKDLQNIDKILLPVFSKEDDFLIEYARKFINNLNVQVTVVDNDGIVKETPSINESIRAIEQIAPNYITIAGKDYADNGFIKQFNLVLISQEGWKKINTQKNGLSKNLPSVLILKK